MTSKDPSATVSKKNANFGSTCARLESHPEWRNLPNAQNVSEWLSTGGPWGAAPERVETHAAVVFLTHQRAYKMKKPVNLGYLDFTTLEKRRVALVQELQLNVRTAPSLYLNLMPVTERGGSYALDGDGTVVEWLLEMKRFPRDALLSDVAARGALTEAMIEQFARHIAEFHDTTPVVPGYDWPAAAARIARENSADIAEQASRFTGHDIAAARSAREQAHRSIGNELRYQSGDVRRCHGDMHLGNAFLDGGEPKLFDCIEFDAFYATIPPLYDLSFLLMDLIARDFPRHANRALNSWIIHRGQTSWVDAMASLAALPFYLALRAEIRAKVDARKPGGHESAGHYIDLVPMLLRRPAPRLIAIGGVSGTGKSTLAKALAWRIGGAAGAIHLRTDEIRKRLANTAPGTRLPPEAYSQQASDRVYGEVSRLAQSALRAGASVIVDAVFAKEAERTALSDLAGFTQARFDGLWLEAPPPTLEHRLDNRRNDVSDADAVVMRRQLTYDLGAITWRKLDAGADASTVEHAAIRCIGTD